MPHGLPDAVELDKLLEGLPLVCVEVVDDAENYWAVLQVGLRFVGRTRAVAALWCGLVVTIAGIHGCW